MAIKEFAVFSKFQGVLASRSQPIGLIVLQDDSVEIYGFQQSWKNRWRKYFERANVQRHMGSASPLASMFASPYGAPEVFPYSEQYQWIFDNAKRFMTGKPVVVNLNVDGDDGRAERRK